MNQVPGRKKLRREYLRNRNSEAANIVVYTVSFCLSVGISFWKPVFMFCMVPTALFYGWHIPAFIRNYQRITRDESIPPVTPDKLPAYEILVRGSEEPSAIQSEVLLRAAQEVETPKEELLRVSQE